MKKKPESNEFMQGFFIGTIFGVIGGLIYAEEKDKASLVKREANRGKGFSKKIRSSSHRKHRERDVQTP